MCKLKIYNMVYSQVSTGKHFNGGVGRGKEKNIIIDFVVLEKKILKKSFFDFTKIVFVQKFF